MKKKIMAIALCVAMLTVAVVGASLAYFTDTDAKENTFTVGNVDITLTEPNWDATGKDEADTVYPGEPLAKDPTVTNVGANPCFVRIKVEGLNCLGEDHMITYRTDWVNGKLGENWALHTDGYYYYTKPLAVDATTDALFDQIVIPTSITNEWAFDNANQRITYDIDVTAEAVQAQGAKSRWADVEAMTVAEIAAWFGTCMGTN